jgi:HD-GYP domain-containing protein (c-di-GMP phosphodiesterase class II)
VDENIYFRAPALAALSSRLSDNRKLAAVHALLRRYFPAVARVAVALYDPRTGMARTFLSHGDRPTPLAQYEARVADASALRRVFRGRRIRIVNDLDIFSAGKHLHTRAIRGGGYRSGVAFPILAEGRTAGFVFFNARRRGAFAPADVPLLEVFAHLAADVATSGVRSAGLLLAAVKTAGGMVHVRDPETGDHLERMARYSRLIAQELARSGRRGLDDERIEYITDFAPLHDVGKLGIPDRVLLKPGPLTAPERRLMKTHTTKGRRIVDSILRRFGSASRGQARALRQIAEHHHEVLDGSGYPHGIRGRKIPLEARIAAVADVFDALTSARPYKDAWTVDRAFAALEELGRTRLDPRCVGALVGNRRAVEAIRRRFREEGRLPLRARDFRRSPRRARPARRGSAAAAGRAGSSRSGTAGPGGRGSARP